ncbi:MAG: dihydroorotase [Bacteroidaceae bacterium]|nr:dihydroorotase [Bacteroidaceae bacterium]
MTLILRNSIKQFLLMAQSHKTKNYFSVGCDSIDEVISNYNLKADFPSGNQPFFLIPALADLHVHFREPGFEYKETILSGAQAAENAGYGLVCTMPNLIPAPDCLENLKIQLEAIQRCKTMVKILPYGCITKNRQGYEPADYESMYPYVAGFSDDGNGVEDEDLMEECMRRIASLGGLIVAHCEKGNGNDREREYTEVERNIRLAKKTGCRLHLCHISTKESIEFISKGKAEGVNVTCETAPHYLLFTADDTKGQPNMKMNPPLGTFEDRQVLVEAMKNGTIDVIATDHAPHSQDEKNRGWNDSLNGVVGLESAFPIMFTSFVNTGIISFNRLIDLMSNNAYKILHIKQPPYYIKVDISTPYNIDSSQFMSKGHSCPFDGMKVIGKVLP